MSEQKPKLLVVVDGQHIPYPTLDTFEPYQVTYQSYSGKPERSLETISKILREFFLGGYHDIYYLGDNVSGLNDAGLFPIYWDDNGNALRMKQGVASVDIGVFGGQISLLTAFPDPRLILPSSANKYFSHGQCISGIVEMVLVSQEQIYKICGRLAFDPTHYPRMYQLMCVYLDDKDGGRTYYEGYIRLKFSMNPGGSVYVLNVA